MRPVRARRMIGSLLAVATVATAVAVGLATGGAGAAGQISTTTTLTADPASPGYGVPVTFTATVAPSTAAGSVQFVVDGTPLGSPVALSGGSATSPSISSLAPGDHEVTASYFGDADHAASDDTGSVSVGLIPTSTTVTNDPLGPTVGETVTLTATVVPATATGTVQFVLDGELLGSPVTLVDGKATSPASPALGLGLHVPMAFYDGDATHSISNAGSDQSFQVTSKSTSFSVLASTPSPQVRLGTVAYTATLSPAPTGGTVQFTLDGAPIGDPVAVVNGSATTPTSPVTAAAGSHTLGATYSGDATYGAVADSTTVQVDKAVPTIVMSENWDQIRQEQRAEFIAEVRPDRPSGQIKVEMEGIQAPGPQTFQVVDGGADIEVYFPLTQDFYDVTLTFEGNDDLEPVSIRQRFVAEDEETTFVRKAYGVVLGRDADDAGLAYWSGRIDAGTPPLVVVDALAKSGEGRRRVVRAGYLELLGRDAEPAGLAYWTGKLAGGTSTEVLRSGLLASDEGYRRTGGNPLGYSVALYEHYLDRTGSTGELTYWTTRLGRTPTRWERQQAALIVGRSNEGTRSAIRTALTTACGAPTATEEQQADLATVWLDTGRHPTRLAGAALALACYPDFSTT